MASISSPANRYFVVSVKDATVTEKAISDPAAYQAREELVVPATLMETFKKKAGNPDLPGLQLPLVGLKKLHDKHVGQIVTRDMGPEFGQGAFAGPAGIEQFSSFIYFGIYASRKRSVGASQRCETHSLAASSANFSVNAKTIMSDARFIQHLPRDEEVTGAVCELDIATQNMTAQLRYVSVGINHTAYSLPVLTLICSREIRPNELLGYSYDWMYWRALKITPSFFDWHGQPIPGVFCEVYDDAHEHESNCLSFSMVKAAEPVFLRDRYLSPNPSQMFVLPKSVTSLTRGCANGVLLPSVYLIESKKSLVVMSRAADDVIVAFTMRFGTTSPQFAALTTQLRGLGIRHMSREAPAPTLAVRVQDLSKLEPAQADGLFQSLNAAAKSSDECDFRVYSSGMVSESKLEAA